MAASVQFRPHNRDLGMVMREVDEDLAIFLGVGNGEKPIKDNLLVQHSDEFGNSIGVEPMPDSLLTSNASPKETDQIVSDDNLLKLEIEKSDFDWLLTPAEETSLIPLVEADLQDTVKTTTEFANGEGISLESKKLACERPASADCSAAVKTRPSSSGNPKRAATPTRRPALPAKPKPSRVSTPTSRTTVPSSKTVATEKRSSTPSKAAPCSSTPNGRPSLPVGSKNGPRSSTPTRKPATPSVSSVPDQSLSGRKIGTNMSKNPVPSRGACPIVKSRPSKQLEILSVSCNAPQNLKPLMPKRPASASRGRPRAPAAPLSSSNGKLRQKSCSPARGRAPNLNTVNKTGTMMISRSRVHGSGEDDVNPVLMGTQMVERVVNMRKLAPPKQEECLSNENTRKPAKASGFGRSLSSKSLDMAVRHMNISRSMADGIRPVATSVSSSSQSRSQSRSVKSSAVHASASPVASTSDSSESNISINSRFFDKSEMEEYQI